MERRLAAILAADVVGYARLTRDDEEGTFAALRALRAEVIDPQFAKHNGRIVKLMGDGLLAEFGSVVDAVRNAVEVQQTVAECQAGLPEDRQIVFRVGINLGDVIVDGEDIHGDGVNIAARLEGLASPGGVCISGAVYEQVRDRLDLHFEDMGDQEVKNIDRPVRAWRWVPEADTASESPASPVAFYDKPAIAVLPFDNMSGASEHDYLGDGLSEEIITALADWRLFPVIARNSTFVYKGAPVDVTTVGQELGARYVVEGSFRVAGSRIRVIAQLIDATNKHHVWTDRYDRELDDIFALQEEIARTIAGAIEPELMQFEQQRIERRPLADLAAWEQYIAGMNCIYSSTRQELERGTVIFEQMRQRFPDYSMSHAGWSLVVGWRMQSGWLAEDEDLLGQELKAAQAAVELDRNNCVAYLALGGALSRLQRYSEAIAAGRQAIALNPSSSMAYWFLGITLNFEGEHREALQQFDTAIRLSPRDPAGWLMRFYSALAQFQIGEFDKAIELAQQVLNERPRQQGSKLIQAAAHAHAGRVDDAKEAMAGYLGQAGNLNPERLRQVFRFSEPAKFENLLDGLRKAGQAN